MKKIIGSVLVFCVLASDAAVMPGFASPADWPAPWSGVARVGSLNPNTDTAANIHNNGTMYNLGEAVDFMMSTGTRIYAPADSTVVCASNALNLKSDVSCERGHSAKYGKGGYGVHAILRCDNEELVFGHLSAVYVSKGQSVRKGDLIGLSGSTGNSSAPHLHFEIVRKKGQVSSLFGKPLSWFTEGKILYGGFGTQSPAQPNPNPNPNPDPGQGDDHPVTQPSGLAGFYNANAGPTLDQWNYYRGIGNAPRASEMGFPNDELSHVEILADGVVVELFTDDGYSGQSLKLSGKGKYDLRGDAMNNLDNLTSSYKVYYASEGPVQDTPPAPAPSYEVTGVSSVSGTVVVSIISNSGQTTSIPCSRGPDDCSLVRLPDQTRWTIGPDIEVLDSDPRLASGEGEMTGPSTIRFRSGQTVVFGTHGGASVSCSFWIAQDNPPATTQQPSPTHAPVPDPTFAPAPTSVPAPVDGGDNDSGTSIKIPDEININGGAGCNSGVCAVIMLAPLLFRKKY